MYESTIKDKISTKFILSYALYFPTYKIIDFLNMPPIKALFLNMIGCKIGKNVVLGGGEWIFDPCVTEIGNNTTIGARTMVLGHLGEGHLIIKKTKIGNLCLIGSDSFIMPGAIIEDNVVLGAKSLVLKDQILHNHVAVEVLELVERIHSPALTIMLDTFHINIEESSLDGSVYLVGKQRVTYAKEVPRGRRQRRSAPVRVLPAPDADPDAPARAGDREW